MGPNRYLGFVCILVGLGGFGAAAADTLPSFERVHVLDRPTVVGNHVLINIKGEEFSFADLKGRPALVFFGFTHCPDVCPATLLRIQSFYEASPDIADRVPFVLVSVDAERDTPEALRQFLKRFDRRFLGATADSGVIQRIATEFRAPFFKSNPSGEQQNYTIAHSPAVFVLDGEGLLRAEFHNATFEAMGAVLSALLPDS